MRGGGAKDRLTEVDLRRDQGCFRDLSWRASLPDGVQLDELRRVLADRSFTERTPGPGVLTFADEAGHLLVVVPRTRRVQIRVSYTISLEERAPTAARLATLLACPAEAQ